MAGSAPPADARRVAVWMAVPVTMALLTWTGRAAGANPPTIGFVYMVAVLALATWGGWAAGAVASVLAMLCFNFFFFPPFGTLTVEDPANWVALLSFLTASALASRLVVTARAQAEEARRRQHEVEVLYKLSLGLFTVSQRSGALGEATVQVLREIGAESGALFIPGSDGEPVALSTIGGGGGGDPALLERAWRSQSPVEIQETGGGFTAYLPLRLGGHFGGVLVVRGQELASDVLEPAARLLALAVERERLLTEAAHLQAVRESDALKTALLRAVSHDLRTPLTAMRLEIESLESRLAGWPEVLASLHGLAVEQARLARRIDNLLALARLEAGLARPRPEPMPAGSLFRASRESLAPVLARRELATHIARGCPDLLADPSLTAEILVNLLENAARATPVEAPLELAASRDPDRSGSVRLEVLDRGMGVRAGDLSSGGLGLRIATSFAEAQGGSLKLIDRPGGGTIARVILPAAPELPEETA